ncbi:MAG: hypothetical protein Q4C00_00355 [Bacillota bacterium]|nr:hypothetical protein [Bacillota bacterium]
MISTLDNFGIKQLSINATEESVTVKAETDVLPRVSWSELRRDEIPGVF